MLHNGMFFPLAISLIFHPDSITEVWVGVKYDGSLWQWQNGVPATVQRYFREEEHNVTEGIPCGKAVVSKVRGKNRRIRIVKEDCTKELPSVCQFSEYYLDLYVHTYNNHSQRSYCHSKCPASVVIPTIR